MTEQKTSATLTNGSAAAAILSSGIGCFVLGAIANIADAHKPFGKQLSIYMPTGPLSGISTVGIVVWLASCVVLAWRWNNKNVAIKSIGIAAIVLLLLSVLLVFPPFEDMMQGK